MAELGVVSCQSTEPLSFTVTVAMIALAEEKEYQDSTKQSNQREESCLDWFVIRNE